MDHEVKRGLVMKLFFIPFFLIFISSCASAPKHSVEIYQAYVGSALSAETVSSIHMVVRSDLRDYVDWVAIDSARIDHEEYGAISIRPGDYLVEWGRKFSLSPMLKASGSESRQWRADLKLEAGHAYTIHAKRTVGHGYKIYSWITDDTTGRLIWGKEYTPGPYDYLLE